MVGELIRGREVVAMRDLCTSFSYVVVGSQELRHTATADGKQLPLRLALFLLLLRHDRRGWRARLDALHRRRRIVVGPRRAAWTKLGRVGIERLAIPAIVVLLVLVEGALTFGLFVLLAAPAIRAQLMKARPMTTHRMSPVRVASAATISSKRALRKDQVSV